MRRTAWTAIVLIGLLVVVISAAVGVRGTSGGQRPEGCTDAPLRGTYGVQVQGTRPAPGGATESVAGVLIRQYREDGTFTHVANVKGSITGLVPNAFASGTYQVNGDCTVTVLFQPAPGLTIEERLVIVDRGRTLLGANMQPAAWMITAIQTRVD